MPDPNAPKPSLLGKQSRTRLLVKAIGFPLIVIAMYLWAIR